MSDLYNTADWLSARDRTLRRDGSRCSVARLLGGACHGVLHVHHLMPVSEGGAPYDDENLVTACASHHPMLEALRRAVLARLFASPVRCRHRHPTRRGRELCERRLARAA